MEETEQRRVAARRSRRRKFSRLAKVNLDMKDYKTENNTTTMKCSVKAGIVILLVCRWGGIPCMCSDICAGKRVQYVCEHQCCKWEFLLLLISFEFQSSHTASSFRVKLKQCKCVVISRESLEQELKFWVHNLLNKWNTRTKEERNIEKRKTRKLQRKMKEFVFLRR